MSTELKSVKSRRTKRVVHPDELIQLNYTSLLEDTNPNQVYNLTESEPIDVPDNAIAWEFEGQPLTVDFSRILGVSGTPLSLGHVQLEKHPDLQPFLARGINSNPGLYHELAKSPEVESALSGPSHSIVSAKFQVTKGKLPKWSTFDDEIARDRQFAFCERVFYSWGAKAFRTYLREVFATAPISGFYTGEISAELETFGGREWLMPTLPQFRAPWRVRRWIHQGDALRGVEYEFTSIDTFGRMGSGNTKSSQVVIPIEKLVHIAAGQVGSNWEGVSWLRSSWQHLKILQNVTQLWALACEVNALGTMVATSDKDNKTPLDYSKVLNEHLGNYTAQDVPYVEMTPGWDLKSLSPNTQIPDLTNFVNFLERQIAKSLGNAHSLIALQKAGSFAARSDASAEARQAWNYISEEFVSDPIESQIFRRFIKLNFPADAAAGRIFVPNISTVDQSQADPTVSLDNLIKADASGLLQGEHADFVRRLLKLPTNEGGV